MDRIKKEDFLSGKNNPVNKELANTFMKVDFLEESGKGVPTIVEKYGASVFEFGYDDYSYTMEFANNTLEKYIKNNLLSEEDCIDIILQIISIFSKVHKRNVIHRDISPNNIFIMSSNKIKVADFGLGERFYCL